MLWGVSQARADEGHSSTFHIILEVFICDPHDTIKFSEVEIYVLSTVGAPAVPKCWKGAGREKRGQERTPQSKKASRSAHSCRMSWIERHREHHKFAPR